MPTTARLERTLALLRDAGLPAYLAGAIDTDSSGNLKPPTPDVVMVDLITEERARATMATPVVSTTVQVTCLGRSPSASLALLDQVRLALPFPEFDPGTTATLGRLPTTTGSLWPVLQRFTIHFSPIADAPAS